MDPDTLARGLKESLSSKYDLVNQEEISSDGFSKAMSKVNSDIAWITGRAKSHGYNRFQILATIDEGNFGHSFLARLESKELLRVTIPFAGKLTSKRHYDQFLSDCQIAQTLKHPNIQTPVEFGHWDTTRHYYATKYLESRASLATLAKTVFKKTNLDSSAAFSIFQQVIEAIAYAHKKNIWHRNLSPDTIWINNLSNTIIAETELLEHDASVLVSEFGMSLDSRYQFELLQVAENINTFMAPESINNNADYIDQRSDIYSLGRILKLLVKVSQSPDEETKKKIEQIISKSTKPKRSERYQSLTEFKEAWKDASGQSS